MVTVGRDLGAYLAERDPQCDRRAHTLEGVAHCGHLVLEPPPLDAERPDVAEVEF
jgi:hypothetical protein